MASWKPKYCSCYVILINHILCNKDVLDNKFIHNLLITENIMGKPHLKSVLHASREKSTFEKNMAINV